MHQAELRLGAVEVLRQQLFGHALEIPERLVQVQAEAEPGSQGPDFLGAARGDQQVLFEDFNAVEARVGAGVHFLFERSAQANGGNGSAQQGTFRRR